MLNASIFRFIILNLVKKDILEFHVTTATDLCLKAYERSNSQLFSQSTLKENHGNTKSINFNYHCAKFSQQRSFFNILSYYKPLDIVHDNMQSVVPFIDSSGCPEMFFKMLQTQLENTCVGVSFLMKLQASAMKLY